MLQVLLLNLGNVTSLAQGQMTKKRQGQAGPNSISGVYPLSYWFPNAGPWPDASLVAQKTQLGSVVKMPESQALKYLIQ